YSSWDVGWSLTKKHWCCHHESRGCQQWDCTLNLRNWEAKWPLAKKQFCCERMGTGCPSTTSSEPFQCFSNYDHWERWSPSKKHWCCAHHERACDPFDCSEELHHWKTMWSLPKKAWCCEKSHQGCEEKPEPLVIHHTHMHKADTIIISNDYNCHAGVHHWKTAWSGPKMQFCCHRYGIGCPFNCFEGSTQRWSHDQKEWCCQHSHMGCQTGSIGRAHYYHHALHYVQPGAQTYYGHREDGFTDAHDVSVYGAPDEDGLRSAHDVSMHGESDEVTGEPDEDGFVDEHDVSVYGAPHEAATVDEDHEVDRRPVIT
ncbi:unnamed protein product, partial [Symbiodinium sp. KB8]